MCAFARDAHGSFDVRAGGFSPDRVDALVWALTDLLVGQMPAEGIYEMYRRLSSELADAARRKAAR
jgi:phage terminase large subunit-like protein